MQDTRVSWQALHIRWGPWNITRLYNVGYTISWSGAGEAPRREFDLIWNTLNLWRGTNFSNSIPLEDFIDKTLGDYVQQD